MERAARWVSIAVIVTVALAIVSGWAIGAGWRLLDMDVYWTAGEQWRAVGNPYAPTEGTTGHTAFRYAPWFAAIWAGASTLPRGAVAVGWSILLVAGTFLAVVPVLRARGGRAIPLAILMGGLLFGMSASGNVQPLMIAVLAWTLERRSGPMWIGIAGSLKVVPLLFLIPYAAQRQWTKVAIGLVVAAVLWAPTLAFDLPAVTTTVDYGGLSASLFTIHPVLWLAAGIAAVTAAVLAVIKGSDLGWLATGTATILVLPRFFLYDVTLLLPAARRFRREG